LASKTVSFEEFSKIDMRIGRIIEAEPVPNSKKLLKLKIDLGGGVVKQSVAGLADQYKPEELKSKLVAVVTNLAPRKIFGLESEVMLLAAVDGDKVSILQPDKQPKEGSKIT
jgi:methionine--tRNA ligase beta chain